MPNLDYYLQLFSNPATTADQKQQLTPEFSAKLYNHAIALIQKCAADSDDGKKTVNGFMQCPAE